MAEIRAQKLAGRGLSSKPTVTSVCVNNTTNHLPSQNDQAHHNTITNHHSRNYQLSPRGDQYRNQIDLIEDGLDATRVRVQLDSSINWIVRRTTQYHRTGD